MDCGGCGRKRRLQARYRVQQRIRVQTPEAMPGELQTALIDAVKALKRLESGFATWAAGQPVGPRRSLLAKTVRAVRWTLDGAELLLLEQATGNESIGGHD
jgi:hypothetical protein